MRSWHYLPTKHYWTSQSPSDKSSATRNSELSFQLQRFAHSGATWKAFDSSTGFRLPDDSVLSPDASLVRLDRWQTLTALRSNMAAYQANGARLGWY